jgi:ribosomal-protein-alanine N-acetyltransferase
MMEWITRRLCGTEPVVEAATARDGASFAALHKGAFARGWSEQEFESLLIERNALAHRLRLRKKNIGFIVTRIASDESEILSVVIDGAYRRRGFAQRLLKSHLGRLAGLGVRSVFLEVEELNEAARRLYRGAGFREIATRERYYRRPGGPAVAAVVMRRDLA